MRKILILGATSALAQATARLFAREGNAFFLVGRNPDKLRAVEEDLKARGASKIGCLAAELNDFAWHEEILEKASDFLVGYDTVLIAHGIYGDQKAYERNYAQAEEVFKTNLLSVISFLTLIANRFENEKRGTIAVISSAAGERGLAANYVYGASKGAVSIFLQGLRNRLYRSGVSVITIKPGYVDTPIAAHLEKNLLFSDAELVGKGIYRAIVKRQDIVYLPWIWRWIMVVAKMIPEGLFKRFNLKFVQ